jgi:hypothetical protein
MSALKSKMEISNKSFGGLTNFNIGDMVLWSEIGKKSTGLVSKLYNSKVGGRKVSFAKVFCFERNQNCNILCLNLKLLSKSDVKEQEN